MAGYQFWKGVEWFNEVMTDTKSYLGNLAAILDLTPALLH